MNRSLLSASLLLLSCCKQDPEAAAHVPQRSSPEPAACEARRFEGSVFTICRVDTTTDEVRLAWKGRDGQALRGFDQLGQSLGRDAARLRFAMNGGMYDDDGTPVGLYVERGHERHTLNLNKGPGNFHLLPNGVFAVDATGSISVTSSSAFRRTVKQPQSATQSGPMLVIDGKLHPRFEANGASQLIRNGVGVRDSRTGFFAISEEGVSFGRFARLFRDGLGCRNALFLDGSVSSLWDPDAQRQDGYSRLGPIVVVLRKAGSEKVPAGR